MALPPFFDNIIGWLRGGYPEGVPESDYVPLLAILTRRLSDDEVEQITTELVAQGDLPIDLTDIAVLVTKVTNELPTEADVERVRAHLHSGGMPTTDPVRRPDPEA